MLRKISQSSNCQILKVNNRLKRCSVDAEHLFRFHVWTQNICSVFALKGAFSNLSGIVSVDEALISGGSFTQVLLYCKYEYVNYLRTI